MFCLAAICALIAAADSGAGTVGAPCYDEWPLVTNAAAARTMIFATPTRKARFAFEGTAAFRHRPGFPYLSVKDETGYLMMLLDRRIADLSCAAGDRLHVVGRATENEPTISDAFCESVAVVRRTAEPADFVRTTSGAEILSGQADCLPVRLSGILTAHFTDDSNPRFRCLIVEADNRAVYCTMPDTGEADARSLAELVGQCVTVTGLCHPSPPSPRLHTGRVVFIQSCGDIREEPSLADKIFRAPDISAIRARKMSEIAGLGRHRTVGLVRAAFRNGNVILADASGAILHVRLVGSALPETGSVVEVLGIPVPDLYHINLVRAIWRAGTASKPPAAPPPERIGSRELCGQRLRPDHLGRTVHVTGQVVNVQSSPEADRCLFVDDGCQLVKVTVRDDLLPDAPVPGCTIETTGICVLETDDDRSRDGYTRLRGFFVVPTEPGAFRIVRGPSWWTPLRLVLTLAVLIAIAVAVCIWNLLLKLSVRRKSRQLEQEITKRIGSDIKVFERTRLAVELHDALSQTLTGVAMEIRAAQKAVPPASARCQLHLARAERTIDACRGELRDCIWDLRNDAMDDPDMNEAIRRTLAPHLGSASLSVRFTVPRDRFSDNTTHAILRIVRELTVNAIRHGRATAVRVAGTIENGKFLVSVRDNGCGFDPAAAPGIANGHFGLQGIRERVDRFEGDLVIDSTRGRGTKVTVILSLPKGDPP